MASNTGNTMMSQRLLFEYPVDPTSPEQSPAKLFNAPNVFQMFFGDPNMQQQWPMGYNDLSTPPTTNRATVLMKVVNEQEALRREANKVLDWFPQIEDDYDTKQLTVIEFKQGIAETVANGALGPQFKTLFTRSQQSTMGIKAASLQIATNWFKSPIGLKVYWALVGVLRESFYNAQLIELWKKIHVMPIPKYMALAKQYSIDALTGDGAYMLKQQMFEQLLNYRIGVFNITKRYTECLDVLVRMLKDEQLVWDGQMDAVILHSKIGRSVQMISENNRNSEVGQFPVEAGGVRNNLNSLDNIQNIAGFPVRIQPPVKIEDHTYDFLEFVEIFGEYFQLPLDGGHVEVYDGDTQRMEAVRAKDCIEIITRKWEAKVPNFLKDKDTWGDIYYNSDDNDEVMNKGCIGPTILKEVSRGIFEVACKENGTNATDMRSKYNAAFEALKMLSSSKGHLTTEKESMVWNCFKMLAGNDVDNGSINPGHFIGSTEGIKKWVGNVSKIGDYTSEYNTLKEWWFKASSINDKLKEMLDDNIFMDFFGEHVALTGKNEKYRDACLHEWMREAAAMSSSTPWPAHGADVSTYTFNPATKRMKDGVAEIRGQHMWFTGNIVDVELPEDLDNMRDYDWVKILGDCPFHSVNIKSLERRITDYDRATQSLIRYILKIRDDRAGANLKYDAYTSKDDVPLTYHTAANIEGLFIAKNDRYKTFTPAQFHRIMMFMEGLKDDKGKPLPATPIFDYCPLPYFDGGDKGGFDVKLTKVEEFLRKRADVELAKPTITAAGRISIENKLKKDIEEKTKFPIKDVDDIIQAMLLNSDIKNSLVTLSKNRAPLPVGILCARSNIAVLTHGLVFLLRNRTLAMVRSGYNIGVELDSIGDTYLINAHLKTGVEELQDAELNLWVIPNVAAERHIRGETTEMDPEPKKGKLSKIRSHTSQNQVEPSLLLRPYLVPYGYTHYGPLDLSKKYFSDKIRPILDLWLPEENNGFMQSWEIVRRPLSTQTYPDMGYDSELPHNSVCYLAPHWCYNRNGERKVIRGYGHWKNEIGDDASDRRYGVDKKHDYLITPLSMGSMNSRFYKE